MSEDLTRLDVESAVSKSATPAATRDELEARIATRKVEMDAQPCYRCSHSNAAPDTTCACCANAHTPDIDGNFPEENQ